MSRYETLDLLRSASFDQLISAFRDGTFERLVPGASALDSCSQITRGKHLEDSVSVHTALVILHSRETPAALLKGIEYDDVDLLAALLHDFEKPSTRGVNSDGLIYFPGHEVKMAERVPYYAELLGLTETERAKLDFLIRYHGDANSLPKLEDAAVQLVTGSRYSPNLAVLQRADAMSSWTKPDGSEHAMVRWWYAKPVGEALGG